MRRTVYRGKAMFEVEGVCKEGDWVYGTLVGNDESVYIIGDVVQADEDSIDFEWWVEVDRASVGQATRYTAHGGKEIYEGDILGVMHGDGVTVKKVVGSVSWGKGKFVVRIGGVDMYLAVVLESSRELEVLGNVYENKNLLNLI